MLRRPVIALAVLLGVALAGAPAPARAGTGVSAELVVGDLAFPTAFDFTPSGRIFFTERHTGWIRVYHPTTGTSRPFFQVPDVYSTDTIGDERGLLGLALHHNYPESPFVYAYATQFLNGRPVNRILRIKNEGGHGRLTRVLVTIASNVNHNGGTLGFGGDGRLYATVGDVGDSANAQNLKNKTGKVLRMTLAGGVPSDNPVPNSLLWSFGHRNMFGLTFDPDRPGTVPWVSENGPGCNDEVNVLDEGGRNHGWGPAQTCGGASPGNTNNSGPQPRVLPAWFVEEPVAPTGIAFCDGCGLTGLDGKLLLGEFNTGDIRALTLNAPRDDVVEGPGGGAIVFDGDAFGIVAMRAAPDGTIHFSTKTGLYRLIPTP